MKKRLLSSLVLATLGYSGFVGQTNAQTIAGGVYNTYFYCNGNLTSVGRNNMGQLGDGTNDDDSIPTTVIGPANVMNVAGSYHALFVDGDSTAWSTGQNYGGECGNGTNSNINTPFHITSLTGVVKVASGESHTLILKADGTVWACGTTTNGEFGNGMTTDSNVPVQCSITNVVDIAVGSYHSVFLKDDGTVWTCGYNLYGQLGLGFSNTSPNAMPQQVDTITNGIAVTAGDQGTMVVTADGFVWAFGYNGGAGDKFSLGGVGPGNTPKKSLITNVVDAVCSRYHSIFIKADGTAWAAGQNGLGQLGDGTTNDHDTAVQVLGLTGIVDGAVGYVHSIFLKNDGTVWVVGGNGYGQLGDGTTNHVYNAIQLSVCSSTGIEENSMAHVSVFPNPSTGIFTIQSSEILTEIEIINMLGQTISFTKIESDKAEINLTNKPEGIYIYRAYRDGKVIGTGKLILE